MNKDINISELWDAITPKLYGYLVSTLHDRSVADDVLQNTWLKAIEALPTFEDRGFSLRTWLFAIARNECKQYWRKLGRDVSFDPLLHDKEKIYSEQEDKIFVDQILTKLSEGERELIRLRYITDLSLNDIAKLLQINPIAVRVRMHRAMTNAKLIIQNK